MPVLPPTHISALELPIHQCSLQPVTRCPEREAHGPRYKATLRGRYAGVAIHERARERFAVGFEMDYEWNVQSAVGDRSVPSFVRRLRPSASHSQRNHREHIYYHYVYPHSRSSHLLLVRHEVAISTVILQFMVRFRQAGLPKPHGCRSSAQSPRMGRQLPQHQLALSTNTNTRRLILKSNDRHLLSTLACPARP